MNVTQPKRIAFVGAGNVAWHLAQALASAGHGVQAVYSRGASSREALAKVIPGALPVAAPDFRAMALDLVVIAVPDAALIPVAADLRVAPGTAVVHTSGSQPLALLHVVEGARTGVFYPLQTFSKGKLLDLAEVPLLLEAQDEETLRLLELVAGSLSNKVYRMGFEDRKRLHLAAVFACNFTNHLLGISRQLLQEANLPAELLQPLLAETIAKATAQDPFAVQTGPAVRGDDPVLQAHQHMLQQHPRYREIYALLSESIQARAKIEQIRH
ncbi:DUF2520 domain-containing protein [Pontibacter sp. E15-1]|uniref:Rossmann-like and DUF2520 domain-containing protein n=1 Tax=Pontibacter sp. E15-1 TaxID=2919918 RepID=UPI001F5025E0|nr:Rossmann-like and DUF2520 domain-containing protein [Pontibacter sp. E15-1]MCJ8167463.1 DUF2520 domain-containing protein [Pontibacter sp. E15-1]